MIFYKSYLLKIIKDRHIVRYDVDTSFQFVDFSTITITLLASLSIFRYQGEKLGET